MKQIVCISTSNYYPIPTRKQNVMNRLKEAEILYFDPPVTLLAPLKDPKAWSRLLAYREKGKKGKDNLTVYATPPVLPFFNRVRWINRLNQWHLSRYVRRRMKETGFHSPVLWCYSPTSCDLIENVPHQSVVYDCVDRHSAYPGMIDPAVVDGMEADLARKADQVFCTAEGLYKTLKQYNDQTVLIPNGAAYELFSTVESLSQAHQKSDQEHDQRPNKKPVFGFVGMLQECIDTDCLLAVAKGFPEGEVVLIGRALPGVDLTSLQAQPNVRFKGLLPQGELPAEIAAFDVCLNVFREGDLSKDVSPLKFYEYLATGKPIVSTKVPDQVTDFADVVYIADGINDFVVNCREAVKEQDPIKRAKRMEYGKNSSWDERVTQMEQILTERGVF